MNLNDKDIDADTAAECLRLSIPLMSRHRVPATPHNYAVWFAYVSGENPELTNEIDRLVGAGTTFTAAVNARLHRQYIAGQDLASIEEVRAQLNKILSDVGCSLNEAGNEAQAFEGTLGGIVNDVAGKDDLQNIRQLLDTLISETRTMRSNANGLHSHFEAKSKEVEELQEQLQRERKRATTDPLTGLYNRLALIEQLEATISESAAGQPPSLVMLDIDHFKAVNDNHGHLIGDRVIRFVAQVLQRNIKGRDSAARYGGEEFVLLLPQTPSAGAASVAEAIRTEVADAKLVRTDSKKPLGQVTISAGVSTYRPGEDLMEFIGRADQALYRSKNEGRNRVSVD